MTRVETLINNLPQVFAGQGSTPSPTAPPAPPRSNLRGLGPARTLVLIDGRRLMPGDPTAARSADLNFIPAALVERVDVLTGGASAIYGADAVAGVVNFIMMKNFEGVRIDAQYSATSTPTTTRHRPDRPRAAPRPPCPAVRAPRQRLRRRRLGSHLTSSASTRRTARATSPPTPPIARTTRSWRTSATFSACTLTSRRADDIRAASARRRHRPIPARDRQLRSSNPTTCNTFRACATAHRRVQLRARPTTSLRPDERYTWAPSPTTRSRPGPTAYMDTMFMDDHTTPRSRRGLFRHRSPAPSPSTAPTRC